VRCLSGSKACPDNEVERLINEYGNNVLRLCYMFLRDIHRAEDAFQETFIRVYKKYKNFKGLSSEKTWISRIAINVCKDFMKTSWFKRVVLKDEIETGNQDCSLDNEILKIDDRQQLYKQVLNLPPSYKQVILLYYYLEHDTTEISKILKIAEGTVRSRLHRARGILRNNLKEGIGVDV